MFRKHFDVEEGRKKRDIARKLRKKRKKNLSPDQAEKETAPIITREQKREEILENAESPITCYKCCPKKKRRRKLKRQT